MDRSPAISCESVTRSYGEVTAIDDVSFEVGWGEVAGLLGPNGAGKTTLIRVLTTVLAPTSGRFEVAGIGPGDPASIRALVGVLPESAGHPRRKRAIDHLAHMASLYGIDRDAAVSVAVDLLSDVGLAGQATDPIGTYSRGMRQRLGIARALVNDPRVLFLDEPTLGLDPAGQRDILELVARLASERHAAVVLTSHLLDEVERVADRIIILDHGRVAVDRAARSIGPARMASIAVAHDGHDAATAVLASMDLDFTTATAGRFVVQNPDEAAFQRLLAALVSAGVTVIGFEAAGGRLADEFLSVTGT